MVLTLTSAVGGPMSLRGQVVTHGDRGFFSGSPLVRSADQLVEAGLAAENFALHDRVIDTLFPVQADALAREDAVRMDALLQTAETTRAALQAAEQALARELEAVPDLLLRLAADGTVLALRPSADCDPTRTTVEHIGANAYVVFPAMAVLLAAAITDALAGRTVSTVDFDEDRDGQRRSFEARVAPVSPDKVLVLVRDVTEQRLLAGQLTHQAWHDQLTGLPNRTLFNRRVEESLTAHEEQARRACVLFIDVDDFKKVNDALGHATGDALLVHVAERMRGCLRPADVLARLGGDEFAVLLDGVGDDVGRAAAERLTESFRQRLPATRLRREVAATLSIGVASASVDDTA